MNKKKQLVFIATPFGFGPIGKLHPIMKRLKDIPGTELIFFTGDLTSQIIKEDYLRYIETDERSIDGLIEELKKLDNPYVISSLNRYAIKACKVLDIPCVFIDGLTWLWDTIPADFLLADVYYSLNFLGVDQKIDSGANIRKVPYILESDVLENESQKREDFTIIHIGGFQNPLYKSSDHSYLDLLTNALNTYSNSENIIVAGGYNALQYLEKKISKQNISFKTFDKKEFNTLIKKCKHLVTTSGLTTSLEAFVSHTPISFLLPSNLSQYKILSLFKENNLNSSSIIWDDFFPTRNKIWDLNEHDALIALEELARNLYQSTEMKKSFTEKLHTLLDSIPETNKQYEFIKSIGTNGADVIVDDLKKRWKL